MRTLGILSVNALFLLLVACGGDSSHQQNSTSDVAVEKQTEASIVSEKASNLSAYLSADSICAALDVKDLQQMFNTTATIKTNSSSYRNNHSCSYTWERPDKAEREKILMDSMMKTAHGKSEKIPMRQKSTQYQLSVSLSHSQSNAANFMPAKLSEEQLQARIESAKEMAAKRLTDEQKALAGDAANSMVERMMQQGNQNEEIAGVGDAAYWTRVGSGGLNVLVGDVQIYIGPMIADTEAEDIINAKKIAGLLLK